VAEIIALSFLYLLVGVLFVRLYQMKSTINLLVHSVTSIRKREIKTRGDLNRLQRPIIRNREIMAAGKRLDQDDE
jgi:hypothetical protein